MSNCPLNHRNYHSGKGCTNTGYSWGLDTNCFTMDLTDNRTAECHWYRHRTWTRRTNNWNAARLSMEQKQKQKYECQKRAGTTAISLYPWLTCFVFVFACRKAAEGVARRACRGCVMISPAFCCCFAISHFTHLRFALLFLVLLALSPFLFCTTWRMRNMRCASQMSKDWSTKHWIAVTLSRSLCIWVQLSGVFSLDPSSRVYGGSRNRTARFAFQLARLFTYLFFPLNY